MAMTLTLHIPDDAVPALRAKARGLPLETFAEQVLLERIQHEGTHTPDSSIADAARRLGTFGKRHGLSLGGVTIRELLTESRP
jgi:hypothetical protein